MVSYARTHESSATNTFGAIQELKSDRQMSNQEAKTQKIECHEALCGMIAHPNFGPMLVERYLPDALSTMSEAAALPASFSTFASISALVAGLLRALQFCGRVNSGVRAAQAQRLQRRLGGILSSCLCHQGGVWAVLSEMLGSVPGGNVAAYLRIASLVAKKPAKTSLLLGYPQVPGSAGDSGAYYNMVGIQVAHLIMSCCYRADTDTGTSKVDNCHPNRSTLRVRSDAVEQGPFRGRLKRAVIIVAHEMIKRSPSEAAKHVLDPLLWAISPVRNSASASIHWNPPRVAATSRDILQCIRHAHALLDVAPPTSDVLDAMCDYARVIFSAFCALSKHGGVARGDAKGALVAYMSKYSSAKAANVLQGWGTAESEAIDELGKWMYCKNECDVVLVRDVEILKSKTTESILRSPESLLSAIKSSPSISQEPEEGENGAEEEAMRLKITGTRALRPSSARLIVIAAYGKNLLAFPCAKSLLL